MSTVLSVPSVTAFGQDPFVVGTSMEALFLVVHFSLFPPSLPPLSCCFPSLTAKHMLGAGTVALAEATWRSLISWSSH